MPRFSDSLHETDRNAERLMVEELQEEVRLHKEEVAQKRMELQQQKELFQFSQGQ